MRIAGALLVGAIAIAARADASMVALSTATMEALTPIDSLPDPAYLDAVTNHQTATTLAAIAAGDTVDLGVQLRAIRTLPSYCPSAGPCGVGTLTHDTLANIVDAYDVGGTATPRDVLRLRAAIEALALAGRTAGLDADVTRIAQFLGHTSRDIRAASAKALRALCNTQAITPLRVRLQSETVDQVKLAISAALRDLGTGQCH